MDINNITSDKNYKVVIDAIDVNDKVANVTFKGLESTNVYVNRIVNLWVTQFGVESVYHRNAIVTWEVNKKGEVNNVHIRKHNA